jgi:hypothetical protein
VVLSQCSNYSKQEDQIYCIKLNNEYARRIETDGFKDVMMSLWSKMRKHQISSTLPPTKPLLVILLETRSKLGFTKNQVYGESCLGSMGMESRIPSVLHPHRVRENSEEVLVYCKLPCILSLCLNEKFAPC